MKEKNLDERERSELSKTVVIACYRKPYTKKSLEIIKELLDQENIAKAFVLSIVEKKKTGLTIDNYLGLKDVSNFKKELEEDQSIRASRYSDEVLKICEHLHIDCERIKKKGNAADIILQEAIKYNPSYIVIHRSDKSKIDKRISGSVSDEVCKDAMCIVTILE